MKPNLIFALLVTSIAALPCAAETYQLDLAHTNIQFGVRHLGINTVRGNFSGFSGSIDWDPAHPEAIKVSAEIDATSINTNNKKRDDHLRSPDFLNTTKFGKISFKSTAAKVLSKDSLELTGDLTILGTTRPITLSVTDISGPGPNPLDKKNHIGASASAKLVRQDFGITWNGGGVTGFAGEAAIGDEVKLQFDIDAAQG